MDIRDESITDKGKTVVIVDDVLAAGGTMLRTNKLPFTKGYDVIGRVVLIDLKFIPKISYGKVIWK